jgi:hypothetical protein
MPKRETNHLSGPPLKSERPNRLGVVLFGFMIGMLAWIVFS